MIAKGDRVTYSKPLNKLVRATWRNKATRWLKVGHNYKVERVYYYSSGVTDIMIDGEWFDLRLFTEVKS